VGKLPKHENTGKNLTMPVSMQSDKHAQHSALNVIFEIQKPKSQVGNLITGKHKIENWRTCFRLRM